MVSRYDMKPVVSRVLVTVKQFSQERKNLATRACALILAATFTLSPISAQAQIGEGSLDDMWAEHQEPVKPASEASTEKPAEKPAKKSRKTKKPKGLQPPQPDGDLLKSTDKPASGWDSAGSSGSTDADATSSDLDSKKTGTATAPTDGSSSGSTSDIPASSSSTSVSTSQPSSSASTTTSSSASTSPARTSKSKTKTTPATTPTAVTPPATTDSAGSTASSSSETSTPSSSSSKAETASSSSEPLSTSGPMQPLCKLASLQSSDLVKSGGWPGVGPFAQDKSDSAALVDDSKNRIKLKLSGEDVTHAELLLVNQSPKPSQLLAIQMTADFLLEAVGAQPGRIADFNNDMMKNQEKLSGATADGSVNLKAGTYVVQIQKKPAQEATVPGNVSFLIALDNQKPAIVATASPKTAPPTSFSIYSTPSTTTPPTTSTPPATTTTPPKTAIATTTPPTTPKSDDLLHKQFSNLITSWQQVKRAAVKNRQSASLSRILGGNALATQNRAIEWLIENKRYYEMTPVELKVLTYTEITPGAKYEIETFIKERRQLVSADSMKVEKDTTQAYNVVYTVERIRGAWLITDTRMVKPL